MSKKNLSRKLSLNHETLRTLNGEHLAAVASGLDSTLINCPSGGCVSNSCYSCVIYCGTLH